jgi:hypothetical protein
MTPCNKRGESTTNRIGEIQCNSIEEAQSVDKRCLGSHDLIKAQVDDNGIRCNSELIDPEKTLKDNPLPLKLASGVLIPFEDSISYEVSGSTILEMQLNTDSLTITQEIETVQCDVQFIKLTGCYSCISGANLFIHGQTKEGSTTATLECPTIGFFSSLYITPNLTTFQLIMKVDQPDVNADCKVKCSQTITPIKIMGHLQYLQDTDVRRMETMVIHEPSLDPFAGFSLFSVYGSNITVWAKRGLILLLVLLAAYISFTTTIRIILKKLV